MFKEKIPFSVLKHLTPASYKVINVTFTQGVGQSVKPRKELCSMLRQYSFHILYLKMYGCSKGTYFIIYGLTVLNT